MLKLAFLLATISLLAALILGCASPAPPVEANIPTVVNISEEGYIELSDGTILFPDGQKEHVYQLDGWGLRRIK